MNIPIRLISRFPRLLAALAVLGLAVVLPTSARAVIINSTDTLPTMARSGTAFYFDAVGTDPYTAQTDIYTSTSFDIGLFSFTANNAYLSVPSLAGIQITVSLNDLNTLSANGINQVHLTLDGIDTGIALNGYGTGTSAPQITGLASSAQAANIYSLFESGGYSYKLPTVSNGVVVDSGTPSANPNVATNFDTPALTAGVTSAGQLVVGAALVGGPTATSYASDSSPQEVFLQGGTASLYVSNNPIPFEPSQALGFGLIALFIALWYVPRTQALMKRWLAPAQA